MELETEDSYRIRREDISLTHETELMVILELERRAKEELTIDDLTFDPFWWEP